MSSTRTRAGAILAAAWTAAGAAAFAAMAAPVEPAYSLAQKEKPAVIETLRELVDIESGSRDREGLDRVAEVIRGRLAAP
jgi:glutamate carboxypeptidase